EPAAHDGVALEHRRGREQLAHRMARRAPQRAVHEQAVGAQNFSDAIPTSAMPASCAAAITRTTWPYLILPSAFTAILPSACALGLALSCSTILSYSPESFSLPSSALPSS